MIGKRLIELRNKKKLTQKAVADKIKISRSAYSNYESDFREPDFKNVELLADVFGVSVDYLLGRDLKESSIEDTKLEGYAKRMAELVRMSKNDEQAKKMLDLAEDYFKK